MYTEYNVLKKCHGDVDDVPLASFQYNHFRLSWYSFLSLLDIDYDKGFTCDACGEVPKLVIMDGTAVSFRRALDSWQPFLDTSNTQLKPKEGR